MFNFDLENTYIEDYSLTPFYRMYFKIKVDYGAKGFFIEGFTSFFGGVIEDYTHFENDTLTTIKGEDYFDIFIGLAIGKKWINSAGFVFEMKVGGGRNLLGEAPNGALFKGDFSIGYRF